MKKEMIMLSQEKLNSYLELAVSQRNHAMATELLKKGAKSKHEYDTPLHTAAANGDHQMIALLLDYDFSANQLNNNHKTPIELVPETDWESYCALLLTNKIRVQQIMK